MPSGGASQALRELRFLWASRHGSGFPWPTWRGFGGGLHMAVFGFPPWCAMPLWKQALQIPLRPWRYFRRVRAIAYTRAMWFRPEDYDDVP